MKASIEFTSPMSPAGPGPSPSTPPAGVPKKPDPIQEQNERKRKRLQQQQDQIKQKLKQLPPQQQPKAPMAGFLRDIASKMVQSAGPNDEPMALYAQIRPLINKLGMVTMVVPNKTQLMLGQTQGKNSNYCIQLRRTAEITPTIIDRIKREEKSLDRIMWDSAGIKMYVWWPYTPPAVEGAPPPAAPAGGPV
jgi:hypothetical protein